MSNNEIAAIAFIVGVVYLVFTVWFVFPDNLKQPKKVKLKEIKPRGQRR